MHILNSGVSPTNCLAIDQFVDVLESVGSVWGATWPTDNKRAQAKIERFYYDVTARIFHVKVIIEMAITLYTVVKA